MVVVKPVLSIVVQNVVVPEVSVNVPVIVVVTKVLNSVEQNVVVPEIVVVLLVEVHVAEVVVVTELWLIVGYIVLYDQSFQVSDWKVSVVATPPPAQVTVAITVPVTVVPTEEVSHV